VGNEINLPDDVPNMQMGCGFNSISQTPSDLVMEVSGRYSTLGDPGASTITTSIVMLKSRQDLEKTLGVQGSMSMGLGGFGASGTVDLLNSMKVSQYTVVCAVCVTVKAQQEVLTEYKLKEAAKAFLTQPETFFRFAGDQFVSSRRLGGELIALLRLESANSTEQRELEANFAASYGGLFKTSAKVSAKIGETIEKYKGTYFVIKRGGQPALPGWDVEKVRDAALSFGSEVMAEQPRRVPFRVATMPYSSLIDYAGANYYDIARASDVVRRLSRSYGDAAERLDAVRFVLEHPEQFLEPDIPALVNADKKLTQAMNLIRAMIQGCIVTPQDGVACRLLAIEELYNPQDVLLPKRISGRFRKGQGPVCGIAGYEMKSVPRTCRHPSNGEEIAELRHFDVPVRFSSDKKSEVERQAQSTTSNPNQYASTDPASRGFDAHWRHYKTELTENRIIEEKHKVCDEPPGEPHGKPHNYCRTETTWTLVANVRVYFARVQWKEGPNEACGVDLVPDLTKPIYNTCEHPSFGYEE
jgi:hypothetical protein